MTDINTEAERILNQTGYKVVFQYPDDFLTVPVISFYTLTEGPAMAADNAELVQRGSVEVDIWARTPKETSDIAVNVNDCMSAEGWIRQFSMDQKKEADELVYHKTMRFNKFF